MSLFEGLSFAVGAATPQPPAAAPNGAAGGGARDKHLLPGAGGGGLLGGTRVGCAGPDADASLGRGRHVTAASKCNSDCNLKRPHMAWTVQGL